MTPPLVRCFPALFLGALVLLWPGPQAGAKTICDKAKAFQITDQSDLLIGPKTEGRVGDFKLCNSRLSAVIEGARDSNGYHPYGGMVVDLVPNTGGAEDLYDKAFFLITAGGNIFGLRTVRATAARVVQGQGEARVIVTAEDAPFPVIESYFNREIPAHGFTFTIEYVLRDGASEIETLVTTHTGKNKPVLVGMGMGVFGGDGLRLLAPRYGYNTGAMVHNKIAWLGATTRGASYAWVVPRQDFKPIFPYNTSIFGGYKDTFVPPGGGKPFRLVTVVGSGDAESVRQRAEALRFEGDTPAVSSPVSVKVQQAAGSVAGCAGATLHVMARDGKDQDSYFTNVNLNDTCTASLSLPAGRWRLVAGEPGVGAWGDLVMNTEAGKPAAAVLARPPTAWLKVDVREKGQQGPQPAAFTVAPLGESPDLPAAVGLSLRQRGYAAIVPQGFVPRPVLLRAGAYGVQVNRGFEYGVSSASVTLKGGQTYVHALTLPREVTRPGWHTSDLHLHFMPSMDSDHTMEDAMLAVLAHGIEIPVTTDHNVVTDPLPTIRRLGIGKHLLGVTGLEMTTYSTGHFNVFPLKYSQNALHHGFAIADWHRLKVPQLFDRMRVLHGQDILFQINHGIGRKGGFFTESGYDPPTGTARDKTLFPDDMQFDLMEILNNPDRNRMAELMRVWVSFARQGRRVVMTGVSDTHEYWSLDTGLCRTYVQTGKNHITQVGVKDFTTPLKKGRAVVSCGQFMDMAAIANGKRVGGLGDTVKAPKGAARVKIHVKAAQWIGAKEVTVMVNGAVPVKTIPVPQKPGPVDFVVEVPLSLTEDSFVYAMVQSDKPLAPFYFGGQATALTNPIFFDVNGDGRWTPPQGK